MSNVSPDELRSRAAAVESFNRYWYADPKTSEIRRQSLRGWQQFLNIFWKKKHKVSDLYGWVSKNWANEQMNVFPIAIEHDNIPAR